MTLPHARALLTIENLVLVFVFVLEKLSNISIYRFLLLLKHTSSPFNTSDPSLSLSSSFFFWQSASALETLKLNTNKQFKLLDKNKNYGYYDTKLKNKTKQNSTTFYVTDRGRKPHDSEFFALFQNLVIPLKITTPGEFAQAIFDKLSGVISTKFHFGSTCTGADPGFFLGGGALVSCSTSTPINHIVFFFAEYQLYQKTAGHLSGHPPPRSAPAVNEHLHICYEFKSKLIFKSLKIHKIHVFTLDNRQLK